ncbi:MAG: hypothetical protein JSW37_14055, partial [Anaerolineales bacterium]
MNEIILDKRWQETLAEYQALRGEIVKRIELRQQVLSFTLLGAGGLLSLGLQSDEVRVTLAILLMYTVLALFLALVWMQSDLRVHDMAEYIRTRIEPAHDGLCWETFLRGAEKLESPATIPDPTVSHSVPRPIRLRDFWAALKNLWPALKDLWAAMRAIPHRPAALSAAGVFVGTQLIAVALALGTAP